MKPRAFAAQAWHSVPGRGLIAVVHMDDVDALGLSPGDIVEINGVLYGVRGVERMRFLTDPTRLSAEVGLLVRPVASDAQGHGA